MRFKVAISTCPNDIYMFEALINNRIGTGGYTFNFTYADIDELNSMAKSNEFDLIKISFNAYPPLSNHYQLSRSGSALGYGNGPLLISKHKITIDLLPSLTIAVPGIETTANLLLNNLLPRTKKIVVYPFYDIERAVSADEADAGVIIHETRFSYHSKGLQLVADLGHEWEKQYKTPLPLGAIAIKRNLSDTVKNNLQQLIHDSIKYAFMTPHVSMDCIKQHSQDLNDDVIKQHIALYVNQYSLEIDDKARHAIDTLLSMSAEGCQIRPTQPIFSGQQ